MVLPIILFQGCPQAYDSRGPFYEITLGSTVDFQTGSSAPVRNFNATIFDGTQTESGLTVTVNSTPLTWSDSNYTSNSIIPDPNGSLQWNIIGNPAISLPSLKINIISPSTPQLILYPTDTSIIDKNGPITVRWVPDSSSDSVFVTIYDNGGHDSGDYWTSNDGSLTLSGSMESLSWMNSGSARARVWRYHQVDSNYIHVTSNTNFWYLTTAAAGTSVNFILK